MTRLDAESSGRDRRDGVETTRRSYLAGVVVGAGALAGCLSGGTETSGGASGGDDGRGERSAGVAADDVPEFSVDEDAQPTPLLLDAAIVENGESLEFLDSFAAELAVGNAGGAAITDQELEVATKFAADGDGPGESVNEPAPVAAELPEIEPGEWESVEVELRVNAGGTWTIETDAREHPAFDPRLEAGPKRLGRGDAVASAAGQFEITALEPRFERALHYETEEGGVGMFTEEATGLRSAGDGRVLVLHRFRVENASDERSLGFGQVLADNRFANAALSGDPAGVVTGDRMRDDLDALVLEGDDVPFGDSVIEPGQTATFAAIQAVDEDDLPAATVTLSLWGGTEDVLFDAVEEAPPLPDFELVDATIAERAGADPTIEVTVENAGDAAGTFRGGAQFYETRPTASDWVYLPDGIEVALDPGERATASVVASRGDERFRVLPFESEITL